MCVCVFCGLLHPPNQSIDHVVYIDRRPEGGDQTLTSTTTHLHTHTLSHTHTFTFMHSGAGMPEFFAAVDAAAGEFEAEYLPELLRQKARRIEDESRKQEQTMQRLMADMKVAGGGGGAGAGAGAGGGGGAGK